MGAAAGGRDNRQLNSIVKDCHDSSTTATDDCKSLQVSSGLLLLAGWSIFTSSCSSISRCLAGWWSYVYDLGDRRSLFAACCASASFVNRGAT